MRTIRITHAPTSKAFYAAAEVAQQRLASAADLVKVFVTCEGTGNVNIYRQDRNKQRNPAQKPMKFSDIPQRIVGGTYQCDMPLEDLDAWLTRREQDPYYQLQLNPDFQRGHVWTKAQQSAYLEYFLTGGKSGLTIYFNKPSWQSAGEEPRAYDDFVCVDGLQRLTALREFVRGETPAFGQLLPEFGQTLRQARNSDSLVFNINNLQTRAEVLNWYLQMNAGGTPHTGTEIARVRALLEQEQAFSAQA